MWINTTVLFVLLLQLISACGTNEKQSSVPQPNILYIMIDDLGWMDVGYQGLEDYQTPNIDRLASEGMRFSNAYAASTVCSPTRAAAMTGLAPARLKITNHIPDRWRFYQGKQMGPGISVNHLDPSYTTIAERLKESGYATGFIGKWHLAGAFYDSLNEDYLPTNQGFDLNIAGSAQGGPGGEGSFFDPYTIPTIENQKEGEYLPDRLAREAITFMTEKKEENKPFFLCLWNYTVHWPVEAPDSLYQKYAPEGNPNLHQKYQAMIEGMDAAIGRVLKALDDLQLREDTFVVFTSDNGPFTGDFGEITTASPLRDAKGYLGEGGIRVPLVIRWPGKVKAATLSEEPVITMDFVPTFLEVANTDYSGVTLDGESLLPLLTSRSTALKREAIYFHYPHYAFHQDNKMGSIIRKGDYKLIKYYETDSIALFNLKVDLGEQHNLAKKESELANNLLTDLNQWLIATDAQLPRPFSDIPEGELYGTRPLSN